MRLPPRSTPRLVLAAMAAVLSAPKDVARGPQAQDVEAPANIVIMIADGFGPASLTLARQFAGRPLALDGMLVGSCTTHATNSRVTDSAAAATAYACGVKTDVGSIAVDVEDRPLGTILEAAERRGMATGLVSTTRLTHATPACFAAHVTDRANEPEIAVQELAAGIEVLFGGGVSLFLPLGGGGRRGDGRDLLAEAREAGYQVVRDRAGFDGELALPVLALLTDEHMTYEIDRDPAVEPSLAELTRRALELLATDEDGFLLVVEGGRIDHAAHANDAAAHLRDILAYDAAVQVALDFAASDAQTLVVSLSDHETGGLTLGRRIGASSIYSYRPEVLEGVRGSVTIIGPAIAAAEDWRAALTELTGIAEPTAAEAERIESALSEVPSKRSVALSGVLRRILSERAVIGWTTNGHTGVDVQVFAAGPGADALRGHRDNAEVGAVLARLMGLEHRPPE